MTTEKLEMAREEGVNLKFTPLHNEQIKIFEHELAKITGVLGLLKDNFVFSWMLNNHHTKINFDIHGDVPQPIVEHWEGDVYVIWDTDHIDCFESNNLIENWASIWYPVADDQVILIEKSQKKIVLMTHWGVCYLWSTD